MTSPPELPAASSDGGRASRFSPLVARDTEGLRALLQRELAGAVEVERCTLDRIRHDPEVDGARELVASYWLSLRERGSGRRAVQLYGARIGPGAAALHQRLRESGPTPVGIGPPLVHLPAVSLVLFAFPNDPQLPDLARCLSREAVRECLRNAPHPGASEVEGFSWTPLNYHPGRGCTLRFTVRSSRAGPTRELELIAKHHKGNRLAKTFETMQRLWRNLPARSETWSPARPLSYDAERRLLWQEALPGPGFWDLHPELDVAEGFRRMARAAADLHRCEFAPAGRRLESLRDEGGDVLARAHPELGRRHARILRELERTRASLPPAPVVSLHGDFHPGQFRIAGESVGLMDFDRARRGDPASDLSRFASHVFLNAVRRGLEPETFRAPLGAFYEAYARHAPAWNGMRPVCWHVATELVGRRIHKLLDHLSDRPHEKIDAILTLAQEHLEQVTSTRSDS
ncbi:MAG: aminoglycoside phosphotransferase family protein [Actinobacteria bacterium]|nr:aminoglycoside phosphotransferase family protein [Actinomycetota bacterium]